MPCNLPGSCVHGIFQARTLEWFAISYSKESSWPRHWTHISWVFCVGKGRFFTTVPCGNPLVTLKIDVPISFIYSKALMTLWAFVASYTYDPRRDQSWVFTGRTDAEAETLIIWLPDAMSWLTGKDPDAGRDWGQEEKGATEDEMPVWHHWLSGHKFG